MRSIGVLTVWWGVRLAPVLLCLAVTPLPLLGAQLSLSWRDNASNETGYAVERRAGSGSYQQIATMGTNAATYIDTSVTAGQAYCYRVRAFNGAGFSGYSNEACGTASGSPPSGQVSFAVSGATTSPSAIARGQSFDLTTTVKNTGTQSIGSAIVNVEIKDPNGTKLLQDFVAGQAFAVGQSKQIAFGLTIPATAAPGSYFADVSVFNGTWSPMYTYQWHAAALTVTSGTVSPNQPTFVVNSASAQPSPVTRGQTLALTTTVANTSSQSASGINVDVEIKDGTGIKVLQQLASGQAFGPGQTRQVGLTVAVPKTVPAGTYYVDVAVFNANWSAMYVYQWRVTSFVVR